MDPGCAPKWVFSAHTSDQISKATIDPWPPCPMTRFPTPKHSEPSAMPTQDGLRLHHLHRIKKARPKPGHPYEKSALASAQSNTPWFAPQSDAQLIAEKQILGFKPSPRLEQIGDEPSERVQDHKHRSQGCDDPALRCESMPDGIFGKDRENTGKFRRFGRQGAKRARFSVYKSVTYIQIPYVPEQGIFWR